MQLCHECFSLTGKTCSWIHCQGNKVNCCEGLDILTALTLFESLFMFLFTRCTTTTMISFYSTQDNTMAEELHQLQPRVFYYCFIKFQLGIGHVRDMVHPWRTISIDAWNSSLHILFPLLYSCPSHYCYHCCFFLLRTIGIQLSSPFWVNCLYLWQRNSPLALHKMTSHHHRTACPTWTCTTNNNSTQQCLPSHHTAGLPTWGT